MKIERKSTKIIRNQFKKITRKSMKIIRNSIKKHEDIKHENIKKYIYIKQSFDKYAL